MPEFVISERPEPGYGTRSMAPAAAGAPVFVESDAEPSPLGRALVALEILALAIVARWRAIILVFILFVAIWLAVQAFSAMHDAYVYLGNSVPKLNGLTGQISPKISAKISAPPITNCWRDRSLLAGDCFKAGGAQSSSARHHAPVPSPRLRFPDCGCIEI